MNLTILETFPDDPELGLAWNNLAAGMERPEVFFTHQWAAAAARAFSETCLPLTFLAYDGGTLVGVAAMAQAREKTDTAFFLAASTGDYCDIVSSPDRREAILAAVLPELRRRGIANIAWGNVPAESYTLQALRKLAPACKFRLLVRPAYECGVVALRDEPQRHEVLKAVTRKERERRALKKLSSLGHVRIRHVEGREVAPTLDLIVSAQVARFLATGRLSPLLSRPRRLFLNELAARLGAAGWLRVSQLEVAGKPIAWNYGFRFSDTWFWYLPTFLVEYEECSPGSCLLRFLVEEACSDPAVGRLDLGLGDERYKERFANTLSRTCHISLSSTLTRHLGTAARDRLSALVRQAPSVERRVRDVREAAAKLRLRLAQSGLRDTAGRIVSRIGSKVAAEAEVHFFVAPGLRQPEIQGTALLPLGWAHVTDMALRNSQDLETLRYLMRCARRLRTGKSTGYCLLDHGVPVHALWVAPYAGFELEELGSSLADGDPAAVMIFDCWTPRAERGKGRYAQAIRMAAETLAQQGQDAWIFSGAGNRPSLSGIVKAGFQYRFSMVRKTVLARSQVSRRVVSFPQTGQGPRTA